MRAIKPKKKMLMKKKKKAAVRSKRKMMRRTESPGRIRICCRIFQHRFTSQLRQPARNLKVKELIIAFDTASVFGRRSAFLKGLMVTAAWQNHVAPHSKQEFGSNMF